MKIAQEKEVPFVPVTITLESPEEVIYLWHLFNIVEGSSLGRNEVQCDYKKELSPLIKEYGQKSWVLLNNICKEQHIEPRT